MLKSWIVTALIITVSLLKCCQARKCYFQGFRHPNAYLSVNGRKGMNVVDPGQVVDIKCERNYILTNDGARRGICLSNGSFSYSPSNLKRFGRCEKNRFHDCGKRIRRNILRGQNVGNGELPWMTKLEITYQGRNDVEVCGGSLVDESWVLTAAHCLEKGEIVGVDLHFGTVDFSENTRGKQWRKASKIIVHRDYDSENQWNYDFALVQLHAPVRLTRNVRPICLPNSSDDICSVNPADIPCSDILAAGWGTKNNSVLEPSAKLHKVSLSILTNEICTRQGSDDLTDAQLCAGSRRRLGGVCVGDSGGPLMCADRRGRIRAIGVVSFSFNGGCGLGSESAVFGRVCNVVPWIKSVVLNTTTETSQTTTVRYECPRKVPEVENGYWSHNNERNHGSSRTLTCFPGYRLVGPNRIFCQSNGAWSSPAVCQPITFTTVSSTTKKITDGLIVQPVNITIDQTTAVTTTNEKPDQRFFLQYPTNGKKYKINEHRCWNISVNGTTSGMRLTIVFAAMYDGVNYDGLIIYGNSRNDVYLSRISRQPWSIYVPQQNIEVCFVSDGVTTGKGFKLQYEPSERPAWSGRIVDCQSLYERGHVTDGVYTIHPLGVDGQGVEAYCDMTSFGGGWTVFQRRVGPETLFNRSWDEYKHGFGKLNESFWLGNELLHKMTSSRYPLVAYTLVVKVATTTNTTGYVHFDRFVVFSEEAKYFFNILPEPICDTTTKPEMFIRNFNQDFTTWDKLNGIYHSHGCGGGGWWSMGCAELSLNGIYGSNDRTNGMYWRNFQGNGNWAFLTSTQMMIRRKRINNC